MVWYGMVGRCHNPEHKSYKYYGGRGITVYASWRDDYMSFLAYIGKRPSSKYTLERIRNAEGYKPGNVKWATQKEQQNNRRSNRPLTLNGVTKNAQQWIEHCPHLKGRRKILYQRLVKGWSIPDAILTPVRAKRR